MAKEVLVEREGDGGGGGTASNAIWAITLLIIVGLIVGAVYYSGILHRVPGTQKVDVKVAPATQ
jgi:hypothetical protein